MKKDNTLTSAKEAVMATAENFLKSTEETAEAAFKKASDVVTKENIEKSISNVKETAKTVKTKASKVASTSKKKATSAVKKKVPSKKLEPNFIIQYYGKEINEKDIIDKFYDEWLKAHKVSEIKSLSIYFKIEDNTAYCLVNEDIKIQVNLP